MAGRGSLTNAACNARDWPQEGQITCKPASLALQVIGMEPDSDAPLQRLLEPVRRM